MTISDLVLILAFLGCVVALFLLCYFLVLRQWTRVRRLLLVLGVCLVVYTVVLVSVALFSPQRVFAMHQAHCFDDWCLSVEHAVQQPTVGTAPAVVTAHGVFCLVTVRVSSQARGITQRAVDVQVYLLDAGGQRYDPDPSGQQALDAAGQNEPSLDSNIAPLGSFNRTVVFDLPEGSAGLSLVVNHGLFPEGIIIGSEQSFFHKPTIVPLQF